MLRTILPGLLVSALALSAYGQRPVSLGNRAPDLKVKQKGADGKEELKWSIEQNLHGRIGVLFFWRTNSVESIQLHKELSQLAKDYGGKGVVFSNFVAESEQRVKEATDREGLEPLGVYQFYEIGVLRWQLWCGVMQTPGVAILDPWGDVVWRGHPDQGLREKLNDMLAKRLPPAGDDHWLSRQFRKAEKLQSEGEIGKAYTEAQLLSRVALEGAEHQSKATGFMEKMEGEADKWLKQAVEAQRRGELEKAAHIVAQIAVRLKETDIGRRAENEIGAMSADRTIKEHIRTARKNAEGELELEKAARYEDAELYDKALAIFKIVSTDEKYSDTPAAKFAKDRIKTIQEDPGIRAAVAKVRAARQAERWFDIAQRAQDAKLYTLARSYYERIVKEHPDSPSATDAKDRLKDLPPESTDAGQKDAAVAKSAP